MDEFSPEMNIYRFCKESIQYILIKESLYNYIKKEKYIRIVKDKASNICI